MSYYGPPQQQYPPQPVQQPPGYATPQQPSAPKAPASPQLKNGMIIATIGGVLLIVGSALGLFFWIPFIFGILCLVFGIVAYTNRKRGMAIATWVFGMIGLIFSGIGEALWILLIIIQPYYLFFGFTMTILAVLGIIAIVGSILGIIGGVMEAKGLPKQVPVVVISPQQYPPQQPPPYGQPPGY